MSLTVTDQFCGAGGSSIGASDVDGVERDCVFCRIVRGEAPADIVDEWPEVIAFRPLNPVVEGHVLVVPKVHFGDWTSDEETTGMVAACAVQLAPEGDSNLITSAGTGATQTIRHLHFHVVPRRDGDGLALPWTGQELQRVIDETYTLLIEEEADAKSDRQLLAEVTNKLADVAT